MKLLGRVLAFLVCASLCVAGRTGGPSIGYNCYPPWAASCQRSSTGLRRDVSLYERLWPSVVDQDKRVPKSSEDSNGQFLKGSGLPSGEQQSLDREGQTLFETRDEMQQSDNRKNVLLRMQLQRWMKEKAQRQLQSQSALPSPSAELADNTAKDGILTGLYNRGKAFLGRYWAPSNLTSRPRKMSGLVSRLLKNIADKLKGQKRSKLPENSVVQRLLRLIEH